MTQPRAVSSWLMPVLLVTESTRGGGAPGRGELDCGSFGAIGCPDWGGMGLVVLLARGAARRTTVGAARRVGVGPSWRAWQPA